MTFDVDKKEVLRYLGYKDQRYSEALDGLIDDMRAEIVSISQYKYTYKIVDVVRDANGNVFLKDQPFPLIGESIQHHLKEAEKCVVMAATLGIAVEQRINYYSKVDLTKNFILDSCATQLIEEVCDYVETVVRKDLKEPFNFTFRYSPGYGDYPITVQNQLVHFLDGYRKLGLSVTENHLLIPRKSVTALIGLQKKPISEDRDKCASCLQLGDCKFRKEGTRCYKIK